MVDVGLEHMVLARMGRDRAAVGGSSSLNGRLLPPELPAGNPAPQKPDSEGGDLSAEGREGAEGRKSRASLALLQRQGRGNSCSGGFWVTRG